MEDDPPRLDLDDAVGAGNEIERGRRAGHPPPAAAVLVAGSVAIASVSLLAAACSIGGASASPIASASPAASAVAPASSNQPDGHAEVFSFGMPGEAARADRVIEVRMVDRFEFDPARIDVAAGEAANRAS